MEFIEHLNPGAREAHKEKLGRWVRPAVFRLGIAKRIPVGI